MDFTEGTNAQTSPAPVSEKPDEFNPLPLRVVSPIRVDILEQFLRNYPCPGTRDYLLAGFRHGFDIGFRGTFTEVDSRPRNLRSARENVEGVSEAIAKELRRGHTSGPFPFPPFPHTHCSPIGAAPKPDGSVRLILDLSSPRGDSVNDGISQEDFACSYSKFDDATSIVLHLGRGAFMGKIDIKHAFRICPVAPEQWYLLCFRWLGQFFTDTRLPFGSRSSPFIFNTFAIALAWIMVTIGQIGFLIHYLDDFFIASATRDGCQNDLDIFLLICKEIGVPIADDKLCGPTNVLTYLGIEIDTVNMQVRLPEEKFNKIMVLVKQWVKKKKCTKRELLALIGLLSFACKVVKSGRIFLCRLIDLSTSVTSLNHYIYLNQEAREDINWWVQFLPTWNGVAIIHPTPISSLELQLFTDASDLGFGCVYGDRWTYAPWKGQWLPSKVNHINVRELFAIWAATFTWGREWKDNEVVIFTDNKSLVDVWSTGTCDDKRMMAIIRALFFHTASLNISLILSYIPGAENINADLLSRLQVQEFQQLNPDADKDPTWLQEEVWHLGGKR